MFQAVKEKLVQKIFIINLLFLLSGTAMTWLFSRKGMAVQEFKTIGITVSLICLIVLVFRFHFLEEILQKADLPQVILALVFAAVTWYYYGYKCIVDIQIHYMAEQGVSTALAYLGMISAALASFSIFVWYCWFFDRFLKVGSHFFTSLDKQERTFLFTIAIVITVVIIYIYSETSIFYLPTDDNTIFNADSNTVINTNAHFLITSPKNNIKQPLFALYAMPFSVLARILSKALFFLPNGYIVVLAILQAFLLQVSFILISRMMQLKSIDKLLFLVLLNCTYPVFLFTLTYEQYLFAVFWLILFIYAYLFQKENKEYYFIGAAGSMLTSGFFFPLLSHSRKIVDWSKEVLFNGMKFVVATAIFGQLPIVMNPISNVQYQLDHFTSEKLTFITKFMQYTNFAASCFIKPETKLNATYLSYQLAPVRHLNMVGVAILVIVLIGFILNRYKPFARICFSWVSFSFVILCLVGWGTRENGLILYTLYFSWAFLSLAFMAVEAIFAKMLPVKNAIIGAATLTLLAINIPGIWELIQFGINYYYN